MTTQLAEQLKGLAGRITPGEWLYRPEPEHDDWGVLRTTLDDRSVVVMQASDPRYRDAECLSDHRRAKTDPWQANAEFIALVRNALPAIIAALEERDELRAAVLRLRNGYADAASGLEYVRQHHGRLSGVGFDRVADKFFADVTMPEREGLLAGSYKLPARAALGDAQ